MSAQTELTSELAGLIDCHAPQEGINPTVIPRLSLIRMSRPSERVPTLHQPALCLVAQGRKQVYLGDKTYLYDPDHYLVVAVDLPLVGQIIEADPGAPFFCFRLDLDTALLGDLMTEFAPNSSSEHAAGAGLTLSPATPELLGPAVRLLELLAAPRDVGVLAPLAEREMLYRLLTGAQAARAQQIALASSNLRKVSQAIGWLKEHYREPLSVDSLALSVRMSPSTFHHHFKAITSLSPLQYQKRLRLQEARRLIIDGALSATAVGRNVGYNSPSQFSREYRRLFGEPPHRDAVKLRDSSTQHKAF